jgi:hypothetical protein
MMMGKQEEAPAPGRTPLYARDSRNPNPFRVLLVTPPSLPRWLGTFIGESHNSGSIELQVVECSGMAPPQQDVPLPPGLGLFLGLERLVFRAMGRAIGRVVEGPLSMVAPGTHAGQDMHRVADVDALVRQVDALRPDLVLLHGDATLAPRLASLARHGCWVLDSDLVDPGRAGVVLLDPILRSDEVTRLALHLAAEDGEAETLSASTGATSAMSFSQQRDIAFAKLPALLLRGLRRLAASGPDGVPAEVRRLCVTPPGFRLPAGAGVRSFFVALRQFLGWRGRRLRSGRPWFVLVREHGRMIDPGAPELGRFASLVAPGRDYWADPFPVVEAGRRFLFVEEYVHARGKGIIICLELLDGGRYANLGTVLDEDAHLSYPQVFAWEGERYMVVESSEAKRVSLYRCVEFPLRWERVTDLIEGRECVDSTLYFHDGTWYLFANVSESGGGLSDELFLFHSGSLTGPYQPHPQNPVLTDARVSRPAGNLFRHDGRLVRPSQRCVPIYGSAIVFNEVLELSRERYRERTLSTLSPGFLPELDGCHTYNAAEGVEVLDAHGVPPPDGARMRLASRHPG